MGMQTTYGIGKLVPSSQTILEDHLRKTLTHSAGLQMWKPYHNKNMPRVPHSVFGDFPKEYMKPLYAG